MRHREPMNIYFNNANTHPLVRLSMVDPISKPTALIAIGISATPGSNTLRLIATYQRRSPDIDSILAKLQHRFPEEIDFLYTGPVRIQDAWHRLRTNTLRPGASIGHVRTTAGTLGCFVRDRSIRLLGVLSNNHILANRNNAKHGDPILQPGRADGGTRVHDTVAALHDYVEILPAPFPNETDCAWASLDTHRTTSPRDIIDSANVNVAAISSTQPVQLRPLDKVVKIGRTTGYTQGEVLAVQQSNLLIRFSPHLHARFDNVVIIQSLTNNRFSNRGDSGSLILRNDGAPAALLFAGSPSTGGGTKALTFANPLDLVLNKLNVDLVI